MEQPLYELVFYERGNRYPVQFDWDKAKLLGIALYLNSIPHRSGEYTVVEVTNYKVPNEYFPNDREMDECKKDVTPYHVHL